MENTDLPTTFSIAYSRVLYVRNTTGMCAQKGRTRLRGLFRCRYLPTHVPRTTKKKTHRSAVVHSAFELQKVDMIAE